MIKFSLNKNIRVQFKVLPIWFLRVKHCRWSYVNVRTADFFIIRLMCMELKVNYRPPRKAISIDEFKAEIMKQRSKAIFKFNGGNGALLCSKCSVIIKTGRDFTEAERSAAKGDAYLSAQYCEKCKALIEDEKKR